MPTTQPVAATVSASKPLHGQENRSSSNFKFINLPKTGSLAVAITGNPTSEAIDCVVMEDVSGGRDPLVASLRNGTSVDSSKFKGDKNYYIATPNGAGDKNFEVSFTG